MRTKNDEADQLARALFEAQSDRRQAGRTLHDQVGPLLSASGLHLQLLSLDHPQAAPAAAEIALLLERTMEQVRALSRRLNASPAAALGLPNALAQLAAQRAESFRGTIRVSYTATAKLPSDAAVALYEAVESAVDFFSQDRSATRIVISVRGAARLTARIACDGRARWPRARLGAEARRAHPAGLELDARTEQGTIVSIRYAGRPAGR